MASFTLALEKPDKVEEEQAKMTFFWTPGGSFVSTFDANLSQLTGALLPNIEFARIAATVFAADRTVPRRGGGSNWNQRNIELSVPVFDIGRWNTVKDELEGLLSFLTGDKWSMSFTESSAPSVQGDLPIEKDVKRVVLLSGGADSACGAIVSRAELEKGERHILVSHVGSTVIAPVQVRVAAAIDRVLPQGLQTHLPVRFNRHSMRADGKRFPDESSSRSRSLLFLAFGLAAASRYGVPLWIPENGFASLNPPLGPERRGSLSTRTTNPYFLYGLAAMLAKVGAHHDLVNPFEKMTKGEMFKRVADSVGSTKASAILSMTHSCSTTGGRAFGLSPTLQCGVCFGCVVRRSSFKAAGLKDKTKYVKPKRNKQLSEWLGRRSVDNAMQDFLQTGLRTRMIAIMRLPEGYSSSQAFELCGRGMAELQQYYA